MSGKLERLREKLAPEIVSAISDEWRLFEPSDRQLLKDRTAQRGLDQQQAKREVVDVAYRLAWEQMFKPWVPRRDSRRRPIVPADDLPTDQLKDWLRRETLKAAECVLRDQPYPTKKSAAASPGESRDIATADDLDLAVLAYRSKPTERSSKALRGVVFGDLTDLDTEEFEREQERQHASDRADVLRRLASPQQRRILDVFVALAQRGFEPTYEAVAIELDLDAAVVRTQMARLRAKATN